MTRRVSLLAVLLLLVAACDTSLDSPMPSASGSASTPSTVANDVGRYFSIEEIGLGPDGWVTLLNYTDTAASLDSLYLCQAPRCIDLPDVVVGPGSIARIEVGGGSGLGDVAMTGADLALDPTDGEVGLYSTDDASDSTRLWAYIEWGSTPHDGTETAIKAGLWHEDSYAPSAPYATRLWKTEDNLWVWDPGS